MSEMEKWLESVLNKMAKEIRRHAQDGCPRCLDIMNEWRRKMEEEEKKKP